MSNFNAYEVASRFSDNDLEIEAFIKIIEFLKQNPQQLSWRGKDLPLVTHEYGVIKLAEKHFKALNKLDFPAPPTTVPDEIVSVVLQNAHGYSDEQAKSIKKFHQESMAAENAVGALLERFLHSILKDHGWSWCCGNFIRAIDFIKWDGNSWVCVQVKNRDNTENSSSSAIRGGTDIKKWFRTFSKTGETNWQNLPPSMLVAGLTETNFKEFVCEYFHQAQQRLI